MRRSQTRVNQPQKRQRSQTRPGVARDRSRPRSWPNPRAPYRVDRSETWGQALRILGLGPLAFLQGFVPLSLTATQVSIGKVIGSDHQMNHGLPEYTAVSVEVAPDFLPLSWAAKIVTGPKCSKPRRNEASAGASKAAIVFILPTRENLERCDAGLQHSRCLRQEQESRGDTPCRLRLVCSRLDSRDSY